MNKEITRQEWCAIIVLALMLLGVVSKTVPFTESDKRMVENCMRYSTLTRFECTWNLR